VADFLTENRARLDTTTANFVNASRELKLLVENNARPIDSTVSRMNRMTVDLEKFVLHLDTLSQATRRIANAINNNDGTLQLMLEDDRLYNDLRAAADNLDDLVTDIRNNPRKYIDFKVEIF
jgi:phospholipid/cholesterol/gamma-HCH transport system substrate-binding protein